MAIDHGIWRTRTDFLRWRLMDDLVVNKAVICTDWNMFHLAVGRDWARVPFCLGKSMALSGVKQKK